MLNIFFPIARGCLDRRDGYLVFASLASRRFVEHGQQVQVLPGRNGLLIRADGSAAGTILNRPPELLELNRRFVHFQSPIVTPVRAVPNLCAWMVTVKGKSCDGSLREFVVRALTGEGITASVCIERREVLRVSERTIFGYGVTLRGLSDRGSLLVQSVGIGGRRRFGCGVFTPC